jgi:ribonuclease HI
MLQLHTMLLSHGILSLHYHCHHLLSTTTTTTTRIITKPITLYVVRQGRRTGIFTTWQETQEQILGYPGCKFRKVRSLMEAEQYLFNENIDQNKNKTSAPHIVRKPKKVIILPDNITNLKLSFDGGSRGNPGIGSGSWTLSRGPIPIAYGCTFISTATSNEAEYLGLIAGLEYCKKSWQETYGIKPNNDNNSNNNFPEKLTIIGDSKLVTSQLSQRYKVRATNLIPLYKKAYELFTELSQTYYRDNPIEIISVPRLYNVMADRLANLAMDTQQSHIIEFSSLSQSSTTTNQLLSSNNKTSLEKFNLLMSSPSKKT